MPNSEAEKDEGAGAAAWPPNYAFRVPGGIVHFARVYRIQVRSRLVSFELGCYGGPLVIGKRGDPLEKQPGERNPFWAAFGFWEKQGHRLRDESLCVYDIEPPRRAVELWHGNYTEVEAIDTRSDDEIRRAFLAPSPAPTDTKEDDKP